MNRLLLLLALPALIFGALVLVGFMGLVLVIAPPITVIPALVITALCAGVVVLKLRARGAGNSLDGEASLLPSAKAKGGLL